MNSRYYIRGDKLYPRYNKKQPIRGRRALRKNDVKSIMKRRSILCATVVVIAMMIIVADLLYLFLFNEAKEIAATPEVLRVEAITVPKFEETKEDTNQSDTEAVLASSRQNEKPKNDTKETSIIISQEVYVDDLVVRNSSRSVTSMTINGFPVQKLDLPSVFYENIDFSSFQPLEPIQKITDTSSSAYGICHSEGVYVDPNGLVRKEVNEDQLSVNGNDDYVVAMGSFYNTGGKAGNRFLIETSNGAFTVTIGDAKADKDTDPMNMFTLHNGKAGIIEFIIDNESIHPEILSLGTPMNGPDPTISGDIVGIYKIS